jgi:hypothetical protein
MTTPSVHECVKADFIRRTSPETNPRPFICMMA